MAEFHAEKIFCLYIGAYGRDSPCVVAPYQFDRTSYPEYPLWVDDTGGCDLPAIFRDYIVFRTVSPKTVLSGHIDTARCDLLQPVVVYRSGKLFPVRLSGSMDCCAASAPSGRRIDGGAALF